jgi:hypothetical protein
MQFFQTFFAMLEFIYLFFIRKIYFFLHTSFNVVVKSVHRLRCCLTLKLRAKNCHKKIEKCTFVFAVCVPQFPMFVNKVVGGEL